MICDILYKILIGEKPLLVTLNKVNEFSRDCDLTKYFAVFGPENVMPFSI